MLNNDLNPLAKRIHENNKAAGWWSDLNTGASIIHTRSRPEMLMLVVSELAEALHGVETGCNDDHLPEYPMYDVELADAIIRLLDLIAAEGIVIPEYSYTPPSSLARQFPAVGLMEIVAHVSAAMEGYRKSDVEKYHASLLKALFATYDLGDGTQHLQAIIDAKVEYNQRRADHKIENRVKVGGKKF